MAHEIDVNSILEAEFSTTNHELEEVRTSIILLQNSPLVPFLVLLSMKILSEFSEFLWLEW